MSDRGTQAPVLDFVAFKTAKEEARRRRREDALHRLRFCESVIDRITESKDSVRRMRERLPLIHLMPDNTYGAWFSSSQTDLALAELQDNLESYLEAMREEWQLAMKDAYPPSRYESVMGVPMPPG